MEQRYGKIIGIARLKTLAACAALSVAWASILPLATAAAPGRIDVCTMSNAASGNDVLCYNQRAGDELVLVGIFATGGNGTGGGLGNQGGLVLSENKQLLLAVNAGSNSVTSFRRKFGGWERTAVTDSQGVMPISIALHGNTAYVVNAGGDGNIAGFHIGGNGALNFIPGSVRPLGTASSGPAQISFDNSGKVLIVTEKMTDTISSYVVGSDGIAQGPAATPSSGQTPFGFAFGKQNVVIVSEAFGGTDSALSSYSVDADGTVNLISASVHAPGQKAACWVALSRSGQIAYTTNTATNSISSYEVGAGGQLTLLQAVAAPTAAGPIDIATNSSYVYVLTSNGDTIEVLRPGSGANRGVLTPLWSTGVPDGSNGLVAL